MQILFFKASEIKASFVDTYHASAGLEVNLVHHHGPPRLSVGRVRSIVEALDAISMRDARQRPDTPDSVLDVVVLPGDHVVREAIGQLVAYVYALHQVDGLTPSLQQLQGNVYVGFHSSAERRESPIKLCRLEKVRHPPLTLLRLSRSIVDKE